MKVIEDSRSMFVLLVLSLSEELVHYVIRTSEHVP